MGVSCFQERVAFPHWMVRGVPGDADARSIRDPNGGQSFKEPAESGFVDKRVDCRCDRDCAAVHAARKAAALYSASSIVAGDDRVSCGDLSSACAGG